MLEGLRKRAAGPDFERRHVNVGAERAVGYGEFPPDAIERRFHAEARLGANDQEIHEVGEARPMLVLARGDPPAEIKAWTEVAGKARERDDEPARIRADVGIENGKGDEGRDREPDREAGARNEEKSGRARIEKSGLNKLAPQQLHVAAIGLRIVAHGVIEKLLRRLQARVAKRIFLALAPARTVGQHLGGAPLDRIAHAQEGHHDEGERRRREEYENSEQNSRTAAS